MGVKFTTTQIQKTTSVAGGTNEFWAEVGTEILTKLHQLGMPIDIDQLDLSETGFVAAPFLGEELYPDENGKYGGYFGFSYYVSDQGLSWYLLLDGGSDKNGQIPDGLLGNGFPMSEWVSLYPLDTTYTFSIISATFGDSFVFKINNIDPIVITPTRSLSNPNVNYGYRAVTSIQLQPTATSTFEFPTMLGGKTAVLTEDFNFDLNRYPMGVYTTIQGNMLPDRDSGKIITIPLFTGVGDIYYQDLYLTNLSHSNKMAKVFETDERTLLVIQSNLSFQKEYFDNEGVPVDMYTSWEQYPAAQLALDISSTYNA